MMINWIVVAAAFVGMLFGAAAGQKDWSGWTVFRLCAYLVAIGWFSVIS